MKRFTGVLTCAFVGCSISAAADTCFLDRAVTIGGATYRYQVYVPEVITSPRDDQPNPEIADRRPASRNGSSATR